MLPLTRPPFYKPPPKFHTTPVSYIWRGFSYPKPLIRAAPAARESCEGGAALVPRCSWGRRSGVAGGGVGTDTLEDKGGTVWSVIYCSSVLWDGLWLDVFLQLNYLLLRGRGRLSLPGSAMGYRRRSSRPRPEMVPVISRTWGYQVFAVLAGALCLSGGVETAIKHAKLSPPSNLMAKLEDQFTVNWTWDAPKDLPNGKNCNLNYLSLLNGEGRRSPKTFRRDTPHDFNKEICFKVQSQCINVKGSESSWVENCTFFLKGNLQPPVKNFKCIWYEAEPMECTWRFGKDTPPDTNYILVYRYKETNHQCQAYTYERGLVNGCQFINRIFSSGDKINILIKGHNMTLGRFYTSVEPMNILKPRPPNLSVSKLAINRIQVEWHDSKWSFKDYEVDMKNSKSQNWTTYSIANQNHLTIDSIDPDSKYTIRARSKFDQHYGGKLWSEWSTEETIGEHQEKDWTLHYILLFTIPLILVIATILLLVFLKRIQVLIYPPIPNPRKVLNRMFPDHCEEQQHWIKHHPMLLPENLVQEEICSVVLVD